MIQLYWRNATAEAIESAEHGITEADLAGVAGAIRRAHAAVTHQINQGELGYAKLPEDTQHRRGVEELAARYRENTTDMVVLGIGGSALGNIALQAALNPATYNLLSDRKRGGPRLFVLDNVDPAMVADTLSLLGRRLKTTLVNVISKSGDTAETAGQLMIFRDLLRKRLGEDFAERIVATTDPEKGTLREIAKAESYATLPIPPDVGGRFSVLSPVGLFSAAMCGIDIGGLLAGAAAMKRRVEKRVTNTTWQKNIACMLAAIKHIAYTRKGKGMHVMMPYSNRLYGLADWYRQLWAESLGKRYDREGKEAFVGPTPIKALGATDQHSQVQLYREGPNDKLTVFLEVMGTRRDVEIPEIFSDQDEVSYLGGSDLGKLLNAEKVATEYAIAISKRPSVIIRFDEITPHAVGEFIYLYEFTTSLMGELLNINAYDQPAVKLVKEVIFALMGKKCHVKPDVARDLGFDQLTYDELRTIVDSFAEDDDDYLA